jgi:hypothetical protein
MYPVSLSGPEFTTQYFIYYVRKYSTCLGKVKVLALYPPQRIDSGPASARYPVHSTRYGYQVPGYRGMWVGGLAAHHIKRTKPAPQPKN